MVERLVLGQAHLGRMTHTTHRCCRTRGRHQSRHHERIHPMAVDRSDGEFGVPVFHAGAPWPWGFIGSREASRREDLDAVLDLRSSGHDTLPVFGRYGAGGELAGRLSRHGVTFGVWARRMLRFERVILDFGTAIVLLSHRNWVPEPAAGDLQASASLTGFLGESPRLSTETDRARR